MLVFSQRQIHPRSAQSLFLSLDSLFRRPSTYCHSKLILTPSTLSSFLRCIYHSANGDSHVLPVSLLVASAFGILDTRDWRIKMESRRKRRLCWDPQPNVESSRRPVNNCWYLFIRNHDVTLPVPRRDGKGRTVLRHLDLDTSLHGEGTSCVQILSEIPTNPYEWAS
jgi:hypothetical protein